MSRIWFVHSFSFCVRRKSPHTRFVWQLRVLRLHKLPRVWQNDATMKLAIFP